MVIRELPVDEFERLKGLPIAENGLPQPDVIVLVAEEAGEIVGVWTAGPIMMLEGLWVREDYRKPSRTLWKLFTTMIDTLRGIGIPQAYTIVQSEDVLKLAEHGGFKRIDGQFLVKPLEH